MSKKIIILIIAIVVMALAVVGISVYKYFDGLVDEMQYDEPEATETDATETNKPIIETYDLSIEPVDGFINILLLGVDTRNMDKMEKSRSDMIMIASINEETYDVTLTSIYRDTYLYIPTSSGGTYSKITHAMMWGGPSLTVSAINKNLGINIENYAIVNFKGVADLVDAVGGIEVDVQQKEIEQLNKYTIQTAKNIYGKENAVEGVNYHLVTEPGPQTLEGVQAVSYGRIRKGVGDDFKRTERMRIVVSKVFDKVKTMAFSDIKNLVNIMLPQVKTNLKTNDILALGLKLPKYSIGAGKGWPYAYRCNTYKGLSYVFPYNLENNVVDFHKEVFGDEEYLITASIKEHSNEIASNYAESKAKPATETSQDPEEIEDDGSYYETFLLYEDGTLVFENGAPVMVRVKQGDQVPTIPLPTNETPGTLETPKDTGEIVDPSAEQVTDNGTGAG